MNVADFRLLKARTLIPSESLDQGLDGWFCGKKKERKLDALGSSEIVVPAAGTVFTLFGSK